MRGLARYFLSKLRLLDAVDGVRQRIWLAQRRIRRTDYLIAKRYCAEHDIAKLHLGCGNHSLDGWLNADLFPRTDQVLHLDATKIFPFQGNTFDYIFSEHMIEHITYKNGCAMLAECYRVLKSNGKIRIATPDLRFLIDLYRSDKTKLQTEYIKYATDTFIKGATYYDDVFVINNFVRDWGHLFIYDEKSLRKSMERVGFANIVKCELNESADHSLRHLENEERMPEGHLRLETVTLEGTKVFAPAGRKMQASTGAGDQPRRDHDFQPEAAI